MSAQNELLPGAEMEVSPKLQTAIVAHHILQVVSPVVVIIIYVAVSKSFPWLLMILISKRNPAECTYSDKPIVAINTRYWQIQAIVPIVLFIIFWIASKCNYQDLRLILVHFNAFLSTLWFLVYFPFCITCPLLFDGTVTILIAIITGFLSLSSAIFAIYGMWKSARKVVLSARRAKCEHYDVLVSIPPTEESPSTYTDINGVRLSQANYIQPI